MSVHLAVVAAGFRPGMMERRILGLSLLERNMLFACQAGAERVLVVFPAAAEERVRRQAEAARRPNLTFTIEYRCVAEAVPPPVPEPFVFLQDGCVYHPEAIREAMARGGGTPSALADAADRAAFLRAEKALLQLGRKPLDGFIARTVNRRISLFLTRRLLRIGMTPMPMSFVTLLVGLLSGWLVGRGTYPYFALAGFVFQMASVLDGCDGEIARLTFRASSLGARIDQYGDITSYFAFIINLPLGVALATSNSLYLALGAAVYVGIVGYYSVLIFFARRFKLDHVISISKNIEKESRDVRRAGVVAWLAGRLAFLYRRDVFTFIFFLVMAIPGGAVVLLWLLSVFMPLQFFYFLVYTWRRARAAKAQAPATRAASS